MLCCFVFALGLGCATVAAAPVKLIVDTDAGFDVDDVGAISVANALQDAGEAEIIAVSHTNGFIKGIGAVSSLMRFYGRDSVPLGAYKGSWATNPNARARPTATSRTSSRTTRLR